MTVRERIADLRERFDALLASNEALPLADQVPREAFHVDPGLKVLTHS